jgi:hypothetical protein
VSFELVKSKPGAEEVEDDATEGRSMVRNRMAVI